MIMIVIMIVIIIIIIIIIIITDGKKLNTCKNNLLYRCHFVHHKSLHDKGLWLWKSLLMKMRHHALSLRVGLWFVRAHRQTKTKRIRSLCDEKKLQFPIDKKLLLKSQYNIVTRRMESRLTLDLSGLRCEVFLLKKMRESKETDSVSRKGRQKTAPPYQIPYCTYTTLIRKKSSEF
jgi:hypothetical protein